MKLLLAKLTHFKHLIAAFPSLEHAIKGKSALKSKRVRTIFTPEQLERLEAEFERQQYMVGPERLYLAHTLQLTEAQVSYLNDAIHFCCQIIQKWDIFFWFSPSSL